MAISTSAASRISGLKPGMSDGIGVGRVHPLAQVSGDVRLLGDVAIAQGATVEAGAEGNGVLGAGSLLQEGVTVYALARGKVLGDDQQPYTVWIGEQVTLTHKVLIQGPVYLGANVFVGFRSTIFNARLGQGCVVMMHALVQDVDVPAGKLVPSGSVITRQEQADALPDVAPTDLALVAEIMGHSRLPTSLTDSLSQSPSHPELHERDGLGTMQSQQLTPDIVQQVRQYLAQGLRIGTEHADSRRYRSGVWQTCSPIQSNRETEALAALETCLAEHADEYVRMFGIDPIAKQRVAPVTIQRPDGKPVELNGRLAATPPAPSQAYHPAGPVSSNGTLAPEVVQQVRHYLSQGYRIGTEHADSRRYRSGVWQTCSPIISNREGEVFAALEGCLVEHAGEYVRLFGIDPKANQRIAPITIQRPDGKPIAVSPAAVPISGGLAGAATATSRPNGAVPTLQGDLAQQVRQLLNQGYHIGIEHADQRRYRSNVWQTCTPVTAAREGDAMAAISTCIAEHPGEYVRIFGIEPKAKRRGAAITVQRPDGSSPAPQLAAPVAAPAAPAPAPASSNESGGGQPLSAELVQQVNQLMNQGYRLSLEHADQRRYRSGAWQTGAPLAGSRVSDILAALEGQLQAHRGEYVRLVGIDPKAKRRVLEATIQRP